KVIIISSENDEKNITEMIRAGVHGYLLKEMGIHAFIDAIKLVKQGTVYIHPAASDTLVKDYRKLMQEKNEVNVPLHLYTKRECEVLQLLADGQSNRKIAKTLNVSEKTVKNHVSSLFKKMKVN